MHNVPFAFAIILEIFLIIFNLEIQSEKMWYIIVLNAISIIYTICRYIYNNGGFGTTDLDWLFDKDFREIFFIIGFIYLLIWLFLCFIGIWQFPEKLG